MIHDKKNSHGNVNFLLLQDLGQPLNDMQVDSFLIKEAFDYCGQAGINDVHLTTNGFILKDNEIESILNNCSSVSISMTGVTDDVYKHFQGFKVKYKLATVENNILKLLKARDNAIQQTEVKLGYIINLSLIHI